jgi:hypothetical protein
VHRSLYRYKTVYLSPADKTQHDDRWPSDINQSGAVILGRVEIGGGSTRIASQRTCGANRRRPVGGGSATGIGDGHTPVAGSRIQRQGVAAFH